MDEEIKSNVDQLDEIEEDSRKTPERPPYSPMLPETNEKCSETNRNEIKNEPPDAEENTNTQIAENAAQPVTTELSDNLPQSAENSDGGEQNVLETPAVVVKEEPVSEKADFNIPISKTPLNTSVTQNAQITNMDRTSLGTNDDIGKEKNTHLYGYADSAALDAYLDGIATPIAPVRPRLRVKTEFAMMKTPRREPSPTSYLLNKDIDTMDTDILPPPPPATFSSNSNSDAIADGIATPRISLAAINRLRVKTEFSLPPETSQPNNEDFFEDIAVTLAEGKEVGEVSPSISDDDASEDEPIPDNFFDDLLRDKIKEKIQDAQNNDLEEKYSDRLKELERLKRAEEKLKERRKNHKKQKKSKKKSKKRSRSRSLSPSSTAKERNPDDAPNHGHDKNKRVRISPPRNEMTSNYAHKEAIDENFSTVDGRIRIKSEFSENDSESIAKESSSFVENVEEIDEVLTPKQRRERAIKRATALLYHLKETSGDNATSAFSKFLFVSTVRKLPTSHSYVQQQIYENRSPLHTVNNVSYKFNSHTTRFNMEEWGLASLPAHAAKMAKLVGCNAQFIHNKLKTIKIPAKLKKVKEEPNKEAENEDEEELIETSSSLYSNAMTQTDEVSEFDVQHKGKGFEIGVQAEPSMFSIGCQTLETQSPTEDLHKEDEAPIMKILHDLNENQLMAIHAFAEFIKEPNSSANAMEMYKIQMKILDIYKMSQIPSALATAQPPIVNNYTTMTTRPREPPPLCIQSVKGADGKQFSVNDPRSKSTAYNTRNAHDDAGSSTKYDHWRKTQSQSSHARPVSNDGFPHSSYGRPSGNPDRHYSSNSNRSPTSHQRQNPTYNNQPLPTTTKHYGRGALRR